MPKDRFEIHADLRRIMHGELKEEPKIVLDKYVRTLSREERKQFLPAAISDLLLTGDFVDRLIVRIIMKNPTMKYLIPKIMEARSYLGSRKKRQAEILEILLMHKVRAVYEDVMIYLSRNGHKYHARILLPYLFFISEKEYIKRSSQYFRRLADNGSLSILKIQFDQFARAAKENNKTDVFNKMISHLNSPALDKNVIKELRGKAGSSSGKQKTVKKIENSSRRHTSPPNP